MFGLKIRSWMENHIVRPRKKGNKNKNGNRYDNNTTTTTIYLFFFFTFSSSVQFLVLVRSDNGYFGVDIRFAVHRAQYFCLYDTVSATPVHYAPANKDVNALCVCVCIWFAFRFVNGFWNWFKCEIYWWHCLFHTTYIPFAWPATLLIIHCRNAYQKD